MSSAINCSSLATRNDFDIYAETLLKASGGDLPQLSSCKREVCTALWGAENNDIYGIGMIIGYILDHLVGLILALVVLAVDYRKVSGLLRIARRGLAAFHDCASFFAFSIEIASIVMLVRADLGISTSGMGDDTVRITHAVSMLVLLPLAYHTLLAPPSHCSSPATEQSANPSSGGKALTLFVLCYFLAFYPFYSAMNAAFGPSRISSKDNAALSIAQLRIIEDICFQHVKPISGFEAKLMMSFVILTYIPLSLALIGSIIWSGIRTNHSGSPVERWLRAMTDRAPRNVSLCAEIVALAAIPLLAAGHLWAIFRARQAQRQLAIAVDGEDGDDSWTFGQVAAVTLFSPVLFECWNEFVNLRKRDRPLEEGTAVEKQPAAK